jgi:hypothetical protein
MMAYSCYPNYLGGKRILSSRPIQAKIASKTLSQNQNTNKKGWYVSQMVEHLLSMCEALGSIPVQQKRKRKTLEDVLILAIVISQ